MTVKELTELLKRFPLDAEVWVMKSMTMDGPVTMAEHTIYSEDKKERVLLK